MPDMLLVLRPRPLLRDALVGPLLQHAVELARQHSQIVAAASALATLESADEVLVGTHDLSTTDFVVIVRGVPADFDSATLIDEQRRPLWTTASSGPLHELTRTPSAPDKSELGPPMEASLFELPGRTWVIASGKESDRARSTLSRPHAATPSRWDPTLDEGPDPLAIAALRLTGPALVRRIRALRPPGLLAPVGHELGAITVVLSGGADARLRATFSYSEPHAVVPAEATLRETIAALSSAKPQTFAWLRTASTQSSRCCVILTTTLPPQLLDVLGGS
jgi:hypothetical protein